MQMRTHTAHDADEDVMSDDVVTHVDGRALTADDADATADGDTLELFVDDDPLSACFR